MGIDFSGGNLVRWALEYKVALIRTEELAAVLRLHHEAPFSLAELRRLFVSPGPVRESLKELRSVHDAALARWRLLADILERVDEYYRRNKRGLSVSAETIESMLVMRHPQSEDQSKSDEEELSINDIRDALAFLASKTVGALRESPDGSGTYRLTMHLDTALERVAAVARAVKNG